MNFEEKTKKENLIFDGKVLHVYKDDIYLPDGREAFREYARHLGAVCVVPLTAEGEVVCVRQYRYAHKRVVLEIPAGKLDYAEEDRREACIRELREETGAVCERLTHIGDIIPSPAILTERISMYLAEELTFCETDPDDDEFLEIVRIPLHKLVDMVMSGEIEDAKTQTAILKTYYLKNQGEKK